MCVNYNSVRWARRKWQSFNHSFNCFSENILKLAVEKIEILVAIETTNCTSLFLHLVLEIDGNLMGKFAEQIMNLISAICIYIEIYLNLNAARQYFDFIDIFI